MIQDIFSPLFDLQDNRLKRLGNPLLELDQQIDWNKFRPLLNKIHEKVRKSKAGAKPKDEVMMFKGLVLQNLYGLSDDQLEYQIEDRRSFQHFMGLDNHQRSPDAKTFWSFKNQLCELKLMDSLFKVFAMQLNQAGYMARKGQIVDAFIVPAPVQHNKKEENVKIKQGDIPDDWSTHKRRQKDTDARWTKKDKKSYFGYKNHIKCGNIEKILRIIMGFDESIVKKLNILLEKGN